MSRGVTPFVLLVASLVLAAIPSPAGGQVTEPTQPPPPGGRTVRVRVDDNVYKPKKLRIRVGTTVEWRNDGRNEHNVLPDRGKRFGTPELAPGATYSYRFDKPGRYGYYCSFHGAPKTGQYGTVKVVEKKRRST
jgi:plastocyanin